MAERELDIIRIDPQDKPIFLVVDAIDAEPEVAAYSVEEGTCPSNLLMARKVYVIVVDGDTDPHGLFGYVRRIDRPEFLDRGHNPDEEWRRLLPEAFGLRVSTDGS